MDNGEDVWEEVPRDDVGWDLVKADRGIWTLIVLGLGGTVVLAGFILYAVVRAFWG